MARVNALPRGVAMIAPSGHARMNAQVQAYALISYVSAVWVRQVQTVLNVRVRVGAAAMAYARTPLAFANWDGPVLIVL